MRPFASSAFLTAVRTTFSGETDAKECDGGSEPGCAVVTTAHTGSLPAQHSFASVAPENVVLTAVKKAEDANGLIFRVYEWAGKETTAEFHVPPGATGATVTNLMEAPEGAPLAAVGDVVKAPIHPYEILTIRVDYPKGGAK